MQCLAKFYRFSILKKSRLKRFPFRVPSAPQTVWSRKYPGTHDRGEIRIAAGKGSSKGYRQPTAVFCAAALRTAGGCLSQTQAEFPDVCSLPTSQVLPFERLKLAIPNPFHLSLKMGAYADKANFSMSL
jgi:hypothetical protein